MERPREPKPRPKIPRKQEKNKYFLICKLWKRYNNKGNESYKGLNGTIEYVLVPNRNKKNDTDHDGVLYMTTRYWNSKIIKDRELLNG